MEDVFVHETTSNVTSSFGADKSNEDIVVALFGVPLSSIEDLDVLTRKIEAGDYDELKKGMTSVEWEAAMWAIEAEWKRLLANVTSTTNVPTNEGTGPKEYRPIVKLVSFTKPVSYVEATGASSSKPSADKVKFCHLVSDNVFDGVQLSILINVVQTISSRLENTLHGYFIGRQIAFPVMGYFVRNNWAKYGLTRLMMNSKCFFFFEFDSIKGLEDVLENGPWMIFHSIRPCGFINTRPCKEELTLISMWVKIHDVPIQVFLEDGISLNASQIGKPVMLDSFTSSIRIESWGRSSFARCLIEIKADEALKDSITMGIPLCEGICFTKKTVRIEYEWKPPRCEKCKIYGHMNDQWPKNATTIPIVMNNDGFQTMVNKKEKCLVSKEKPSKAANVPSSSFSRSSTKNRRLQYHSSASNIDASNPYDDLDYMESDEEVEVVYDETSNLFGNNITRATYTTPGEVLSGFAHGINSPSSCYGRVSQVTKTYLLILKHHSSYSAKMCKRRCEASPQLKGALVSSEFELSSRLLEEWSRARLKKDQEKDKIISKPDKKREAWRSREKSKAVTVDRGRKTEENKKE
nr:hypothetical protein [Tanacetum cinerariifolium]